MGMKKKGQAVIMTGLPFVLIKYRPLIDHLRLKMTRVSSVSSVPPW
jgi:hypothetical protein